MNVHTLSQRSIDMNVHNGRYLHTDIIVRRGPARASSVCTIMHPGIDDVRRGTISWKVFFKLVTD